MSLGHALKTEGRQEESVAAYRRAIAMEPTLGEAYWSLANLKTFRFSAADDVQAMAGVPSPQGLAAKRIGCISSSRSARRSRMRARTSSHLLTTRGATRCAASPILTAPMRTAASSAAAKRNLHAGFFSQRAEATGAPSAEPIFIVGLPRAGSTLLEQILASHPAVEGTIELPDIPQIARDLVGTRRAEAQAGRFFERRGRARPGRAAGARRAATSQSTRVHRKTDAPFFIDKMPNNCLYLGLIHLILPNAKIIDARRHPLGCCFSAFKQHFSRGQSFTY